MGQSSRHLSLSTFHSPWENIVDDAAAGETGTAASAAAAAVAAGTARIPNKRKPRDGGDRPRPLPLRRVTTTNEPSRRDVASHRVSCGIRVTRDSLPPASSSNEGAPVKYEYGALPRYHTHPQSFGSWCWRHGDGMGPTFSSREQGWATPRGWVVVLYCYGKQRYLYVRLS
jgi:hypothetical protein